MDCALPRMAPILFLIDRPYFWTIQTPNTLTQPGGKGKPLSSRREEGGMARSPDEEGEGRKHKSSRDKDRKKEHKKKKDKKRKVRVYLCLCVPIDTWVEARMHPGLLSQGCKRPAPVGLELGVTY